MAAQSLTEEVGVEDLFHENRVASEANPIRWVVGNAIDMMVLVVLNHAAFPWSLMLANRRQGRSTPRPRLLPPMKYPSGHVVHAASPSTLHEPRWVQPHSVPFAP